MSKRIVGKDDNANLRNKICAVLRKYHECDDRGNPNKEYDECYSANDAIEDIHEIIGNI